MDKLEESLRIISAEIRKSIFETILNAKSGHIGGCSSSTELMTALYFNKLNFDYKNPRHPKRDRVLVRGHLGPLRYKIFSLMGWVNEEELKTYRKLGSSLQGHETMELHGVDITPSGSLGMLLSYGTGSAIAAKKMNEPFLTYVFLGDGEEQEGNVSEAARHAASMKLENLVCILDRNKKQLSRKTKDSDSSSDIRKIWEGYGWNVEEIQDGHSLQEILDVYNRIGNNKTKPILIIANTIKGSGLEGCIDNCCGYHTISSCSTEILAKGIEEQKRILTRSKKNPADEVKKLIKNKLIDTHVTENPQTTEINIPQLAERNNIVDTLVDYVKQLNNVACSKKINLYILTADLIREDQVNELGIKEQTTYIDVGIREQHILGLAHGISQTDPNSIILINAGDAFLYRSIDQLNAIAQSASRMVIVGDDGGLSGGNNGATHQSSGQPGALISMPGIRFLEPSDSIDLINSLNLAFNDYTCPSYIRLHTYETPNFGEKNRSTTFYKIFESQTAPQITLIGSGLTTIGVLDAAKILEKDYNIGSVVINVLNPKNLDEINKLIVPHKPAITIYNGNPYVLHSAVSSVLMKTKDDKRPSVLECHGFYIGTSGSLDSLINHFKLNGQGIVEVIKDKFHYIFRK